MGPQAGVHWSSAGQAPAAPLGMRAHCFAQWRRKRLPEDLDHAGKETERVTSGFNLEMIVVETG